MKQVEVVGRFFDAKNQLETRRLYFKLQAEAHKDYHPSEELCYFGTVARSLAATESRGNLNALALSKYALERQIGYSGLASAGSSSMDRDGRWTQFVSAYCNPRDNAWRGQGSGLDQACDRDGVDNGGLNSGATNRNRVNIDIDYTRLVEIPRTIDVNFSDAAVLSDEDEDVLALSSNLYGHIAPSRRITLELLKKYPAARMLYMNQRSIFAKRAVAQSTFSAIIGMKSEGTIADEAGAGPADPVGRYIGAVIRELNPGMTDDEIYEITGENPSYYAQLEVLGKKIFQNPDFFANLYDKPANVERKGVAMKAIELMIDRALFESELRQEMMMSVMLSSRLNKYKRTIDSELQRGE